MPEANVREVVQRLRAESSQAALELLEFDYSLKEVERALEALEPVTGGLRSTFASIFIVNDEQNLQRAKAFHEQANQLSALVSHILGAIRQIGRGIEGWDLGDLRGHEREPGAPQRR